MWLFDWIRNWGFEAAKWLLGLGIAQLVLASVGAIIAFMFGAREAKVMAVLVRVRRISMACMVAAAVLCGAYSLIMAGS